MALDNTKLKGYANRLLQSRLRILADHGFYGLLLSHLSFAIDETIDTASTDARKIYFSPAFLDELSDSELDFILMHEVMHVVLQHCTRGLSYDQFIFNVACDIVVNSNILKSCGNNLRRITLRLEGQPAMHLAPDGKEGHLYSAEEVYEMLISKGKLKKQSGNSGGSESDGDGKSSGDGSGSDSKKNGKRGNGSGQRSERGSGNKKGNGSSSGSESGEYKLVDSHDKWEPDESGELRDRWASYFEDALKVISVTEKSSDCGSLPAFAQRLLKEREKPQVNWREALHSFVQEEVNDYSFSPPDRRFDGFDFFLPDYNEKEENVKNILFMIDTSGSMTDEMISKAYDEIYGAIEQFNGRLEGYLGFFDAVAVPAKPFSSIKELEIIRPFGGGGTSFHCVLHYAIHEMDEPPVSIIILTDGYAPFPKESDANGIPVMWVINNEDVTPPWGKIARISVDD